MDTEPAFGSDELVRFALTDMAQAVSARSGENEAQQSARCRAALGMIMGFQPRDVTEIMLAGHCVMLHDAMTAEVQLCLSSEAGHNRRVLVSLNKAFNDNLDRLTRYRQRPAEDAREAPPQAEVATEPAGPSGIPAAPSGPVGRPGPSSLPSGIPAAPSGPVARPDAPAMNRAARRQAARAELRTSSASHAASRPSASVRSGVLPSAAHRADGMAIDRPTHPALARCLANPDAMTALAAGDPARFARAMGIANPSDAFLAAANTPGSPFRPQAAGGGSVARTA